MKTHSHAAPRTAAALAAASIAAAPLTVPFAAAQDGLFGYDGQAVNDATVTETVTETEYTPPSREKAPDTDNCPQATVPPEPVSTSERVAGQCVADAAAGDLRRPVRVHHAGRLHGR